MTLDGCLTGAAGRGGFVGAALGAESSESPDKSGAWPVAARSPWAFSVITAVACLVFASEMDRGV